MHAYIENSSSKIQKHFWFLKSFPASTCELRISVNCWDKYTIDLLVVYCLLFIVYSYTILCLVLNSSMSPLFAVFLYADSIKLESIQRKFKSFSSYLLWLHSWARVCRITDIMKFKATSWCSFVSKSLWDQKIWRCLLDTNILEFLYHNIVNFRWQCALCK